MRATPGLPRLDARNIGYSLAAGACVYVAVTHGGLRASEGLIALTLATTAVLMVARWPGRALCALVVFVPLQIAALSLAFHLGAPARLVRYLGYFKDAVTIGTCVAALRQRSNRRSFDLIDWGAGLYVGIATLYLALPFAFAGILGGEPFSVRINAWRVDCLFVVLLLAARRVHYPESTIRWLRRLLIGVAAFIALVGLWEFVNRAGFNHLMVNVLHVQDYQTAVLHTNAPIGLDYTATYTAGANGSGYARIGSLLVDALTLSFYLVLALAASTERILNGRRNPAIIISTAAIAFALTLTETRSAVLGGAIVVIGGIWLAYRRRLAGRSFATVVAALVVAALVPFAINSTIGARFHSISSQPSDQDNSGHVSSTTAGLRLARQSPAGLGLGANPATGERFHTSNYTTTENSYLQVESELGIAGMAAFILMYLALLRRLMVVSHRAIGANAAALASAMWLAGAGLLIGGLFLQVWISFATSMTFWGLSGVALAAPVRATNTA